MAGRGRPLHRALPPRRHDALDGLETEITAKFCPQCGTEVTPELTFCDQCGTRLSEAAQAEEPGLAAARALRRLAPREFADRLLATRGLVSRERRVVTILFSDVKGSTAMGEELDPEDVTEIMEGAFDVLIGPITRYEGALARLMGDGILTPHLPHNLAP